MRRRTVWLCILILAAFALISPRGFAGTGVFGVSEELMKEVEQEQAFQHYLAENNFQLVNQFPFLQSNLLPIPLVKQNTYFQTDLYIIIPNAGGNILERYSLLPAEYMNLVVYDESGKYTIEARSQLINGLTLSYGYDAVKSNAEEKASLNAENPLIAQNAGLELKLIPGMAVNADYSKTLRTPADEAKKSVRVAYDLVDFANISAGYSIISTDPNPFHFAAPMAKEGEMDQENIVVKQLDLALRPTTYSQISASYAIVNDNGEPTRSTKTRFAFRLGDSGAGLNATYEMENHENRQTSTTAGLELGLLDLATLSAFYSTGSGESAANEGVPGSTVDVGFNLNLAQYSSLHLQYKLVLPDDLFEDSEDEQVAEAKFVLRF